MELNVGRFISQTVNSNECQPFSGPPLPSIPINKLYINNKIYISLSVYCLAVSFFLLISFGVSFRIHPPPLDLFCFK